MTEFKLPELGENIDQGDLVRLMVSLGASVTEGQPVMELETDKAVVEVPSSVTGTVNEIRVKEGQKVKVGQVIFTVENGAGAKVKAAENKVVETKAPAAKAPAAKPAPAAKAAAASVAETRPPAARCAGPSREWRSRLQTAGTGRKHRSGRSGQADDFTGLRKFPRASLSWNWKPTRQWSKCRRR